MGWNLNYSGGSTVGRLADPLGMWDARAKIKTPSMYTVKEKNFTDKNAKANKAMLQQRIGNLEGGDTAGLIAALKARQAGTSPSVAQMQLRQTTDANRRGALGLASSMPGGNPALALRTAVNAGTQANQAAAGQGALLRATEQSDAEKELAAVIQQQQQLIAQYVGAGLTLDQAQFQARQDMEKLKTSAHYGGAGLQLNANQAQVGNQTQMMGAGMSAAGSIIGAFASDKRVKMKVRDGRPAVKELLQHYAGGGPVLKPYSAPAMLPFENPDAVIAEALANTRPGPVALPEMPAFSAGAKPISNTGPTGKTYAQELAAGERPMAAGGPVSGPGGPRDDRVPAMLSNGENVWSADDVANAGGQGGVEGIKGMLDALKAKKYAYKGEGPDAEHLGIMAQDLEKSPLGRTMVLDTPRGKMVDGNLAFGAVLAAAADLNRRMNALETRGGARGR